MSTNTRLGAGIVAVAVLAGAGTVLGSYPMYLLSLAFVTVISAVGLNILTGNAGQISLCHSSFMAIGAYASTLLTIHLGLPFWAAIPCGTALTAFAGLLVGAPAMRLGGIYLALVTLGFLQIVQIGIEEMQALTGGVRGLAVPKASFNGVALTDYGRYLIVLVYSAVAVWIAHNLLASRVGRELNAVRQSSQAAQALGISLQRTKLVAFALSAAYAGAAGGLLAMLVGFLDPTEFGVSSAIRYITYIVVGGVGSLGGSVLGAGLLSALPELLRPVKEYSDLVYTLILLGFLLFMPRGLVTPWKAVAVRKRRASAGVGKP